MPEVSTNPLDSDNEAYSERLRLKIQPQPPKFPFRDHPFEITVYLVDPADHLKAGINLPLNVELYAAEKMVPVEKNILHIDPDTRPIMQGDGICKLRLRISECSMALGNRKFVIHVSSASSNKELSVSPAISTEMTVIQHRLVIQDKLPELWYKDEGGRDKCMTLRIHLLDENDQRVGSRQVPLKLTLLYENEHPVLKQDILKMAQDCDRTTNTSGEAVLKLRIEDVSKNHQGQAFRLKVEPDTAQSPLHFDVAYDLSSSISVRSKRNKRRPAKGPSQVTHHIINGAANSPNADSDLSNFGANFQQDGRRKKMRSDGMNSPHDDNLINSMERVLQWTGGVVNGLHQLEWQTVGYESRTDGSADPDRPIYRCPACWRYKDVMTFDQAQHDQKCLIANLLVSYATRTMKDLDSLLKAVERYPALVAQQKQQMQMKQGGQQTDGTSMGMTAMSSSGVPDSSPFKMTSTNTQPVASSSPPALSRGLTEMLEGPPGLFRGNSGGFSEIIRSLEETETGDSSTIYQNFNIPVGAGSSVVHAIEQQVYYVLAKVLPVSSNVNIGFPAFDQQINLLGFYREVHGASTEVAFVPVNELPAISQAEVQQVQHVMDTALKSNNAAVHSLPRCNNNLVKLREDVVLFNWHVEEKSSSNWS